MGVTTTYRIDCQNKDDGGLTKGLAYDFEAICDVFSSFVLEGHNRCTGKGTRIGVPERGFLVGVVVVTNKTLP